MRATCCRFVAVWIGVLSAASVHANVIYDFQPDPGTSGEYVRVTGGHLSITDAAYRKGSVNVNFFRSGGATEEDLRTSPILSIGVGTTPNGGVGVAPRTDRFVNLGLGLSADLILADNGLLTGDFYIFGTENNLKAEGVGNSWRVFDVNSDFFTSTGHCTGNFEEPCFAGTGAWRLDQTTVPGRPVPGPQVWSLFGLALLGMAGFKSSRSWRQNRRIE